MTISFNDVLLNCVERMGTRLSGDFMLAIEEFAGNDFVVDDVT